MTPKILVSDGLAEAGLEKLRAAAEVTVNPKITPDELLAAIPEYDALIVRSRTKVTASVIAAGKNLKVIGRAGVGVDNIDVAAACAHNILVVNSPHAATVSVAELTFAMLLDLARSVHSADASMKQGRWDKNAFTGVEVAGKTLGLLGLGRIGVEVARRAQAFGLSVLAYDPHKTETQIRERGATGATLDDLLTQSDFVSLHLPLTGETKNILDAPNIAKMKKGARLICLARGGMVDEAALRAALDSGHLAGAALDVFAVEPAPPGSLAEHPKVLATPHIGAQTQEAQARAGLAIADEVLNVLAGKPPRWRVVRND